jgi:hypothetical protein
MRHDSADTPTTQLSIKANISCFEQFLKNILRKMRESRIANEGDWLQIKFAARNLRRALCVALFISLAVAEGGELTRSLTRQETRDLQSEITVGRRIVVALAKYSKSASEMYGRTTSGLTELSLLTRTATIDVLHAAGYLSDSDTALARRYDAMPQQVSAIATSEQPLLTMHSKLGELVFDMRGTVTVRYDRKQ